MTPFPVRRVCEGAAREQERVRFKVNVGELIDIIDRPAGKSSAWTLRLVYAGMTIQFRQNETGFVVRIAQTEPIPDS
jgi:hypothetical protein